MFVYPNVRRIFVCSLRFFSLQHEIRVYVRIRGWGWCCDDLYLCIYDVHTTHIHGHTGDQIELYFFGFFGILFYTYCCCRIFLVNGVWIIWLNLYHRPSYTWMSVFNCLLENRSYVIHLLTLHTEHRINEFTIHPLFNLNVKRYSWGKLFASSGRGKISENNSINIYQSRCTNISHYVYLIYSTVKINTIRPIRMQMCVFALQFY